MSITPSDEQLAYLGILEDINVAIVFSDSEGKIRLCNAAFLNLVERERKEVIGFGVGEVLSTDIFKQWELHELDASNASVEFDVQKVSEKGSVVHLSVNKRQIFDLENNLTGTVASFSDISNVKIAQEKFVSEHELLRAVIDILPAFIYAKDREGRFILANQVVAGFMGVSNPDDLLGKTDFDFYPYKYAIKYYIDDQEVVVSSRPKLNIIESCNTEEVGDPMWLSTTKVPFRNQEGEIIGLVGSGIDVTQQKLNNDKLVELEEIVKNSPSCGFLIRSTRQWDVQFCSETVNLFGYVEQDFQKGLSFLDIVHPDDLEEMKSHALQNFREGNVKFTQEYRIKRKDESFCWVEDHKFLRESLERGEFLFQSLISDVSVRHQYQDERDEMEIQLRQAQKLEAVGQLAAGIAHEINTPIQFISDNLQFLSDSSEELQSFIQAVFEEIEGDDPVLVKLKSKLQEKAEELDLDFLKEEVPSAINQSIEGAKRVRDIVLEMKEFSHPGSGAIAPEDINKAIYNTIAVAKNEWKYVAEVVTEMDDRVVMVPVDIGPFKQTILNLIVNAAHAIESMTKDSGMEMGLITVSTKLKEDSVVISVSDNGTGMSDDVAGRVFDPFFTTKEVGKGTGQGLSMAYDIIVRKHNGLLYLKSKLGVGTTFFVELPLTSREQIRLKD